MKLNYLSCNGLGSIKLIGQLKTKIMTTYYQVWECRGYGVEYTVGAPADYATASSFAETLNANCDSRNGNDDLYYYEVREA